MANLAFSVCAAIASLLVAILSAVKGVYAPAVVFGVLAIGFVFRATESRWRDR